MTDRAEESIAWASTNPPQRRGRGRPRKDGLPNAGTAGTPVQLKQDHRLDEHLAAFEDEKDIDQAKSLFVRPASLSGGVNITWLAAAFRIDNRTARKRLAGLSPVAIGSSNAEVYDFVAASSMLAPPDPEKFARWIRTLKTSDLPVQIQDTYWSALRKRQIWEQNAGDLWKTDDVFEVFSEVFKTMKSSMQLWVDNLDATGEMDSATRDKFQGMVDGLLDELYQLMVTMPQRRETSSSLKDPEIITNQVTTLLEDFEEDEDLIG